MVFLHNQHLWWGTVAMVRPEIFIGHFQSQQKNRKIMKNLALPSLYMSDNMPCRGIFCERLESCPPRNSTKQWYIHILTFNIHISWARGSRIYKWLFFPSPKLNDHSTLDCTWVMRHETLQKLPLGRQFCVALSFKKPRLRSFNITHVQLASKLLLPVLPSCVECLIVYRMNLAKTHHPPRNSEVEMCNVTSLFKGWWNFHPRRKKLPAGNGRFKIVMHKKMLIVTVQTIFQKPSTQFFEKENKRNSSTVIAWLLNSCTSKASFRPKVVSCLCNHHPCIELFSTCNQHKGQRLVHLRSSNVMNPV